MIRLVCPHCELLLGLGSETAGQVTECPNCLQRVRVPDTQLVPPEPPPPVSAAPGAPTSHSASSTPWSDNSPSSPRLRRLRRRFGSSHANAAGLGASLVLLTGCLVGGFCLIDVIFTIAVPPSLEEVWGDEAKKMDKDTLAGAKSSLKTARGLSMGFAVLGCLLFGLLLAGLYLGGNGARLALAVFLLLWTLGFLATVIHMLVGANPNVLLLLINGVGLAIFPAVAILLLVSSSIRAYCGQ